MLSCRVAWNPCCGPNSAASVTRGACASRSAACVKPASTDEGLATSPTRRPSRRPDATSEVIPGTTREDNGGIGTVSDEGQPAARIGILAVLQPGDRVVEALRERPGDAAVDRELTIAVDQRAHRLDDRRGARAEDLLQLAGGVRGFHFVDRHLAFSRGQAPL